MSVLGCHVLPFKKDAGDGRLRYFHCQKYPQSAPGTKHSKSLGTIEDGTYQLTVEVTVLYTQTLTSKTLWGNSVAVLPLGVNVSD
jgi:hypothetical protein